MRYRVLIILFLLLISSCNVKKKISRQSSESEESTTYEKIQTDEKDLEKTTSFDESVITRRISGSFVEIVPRGAFRISPDGTFEGEASEVRIYHRDTTESNQTRKLNQKETDRSRSEAAEKEDRSASLSISEMDKEVKRTPNFFVWIGIALGIVALIAGLRLLNKFKIF